MFDSAVSVQLLGKFRVTIDKQIVELPKSRKARAILAYLAVSKSLVSRNTLCSIFFADTDDPKGGLRWCLSRLRKAFPAHSDIIQSDANNVWLAIPDAAIDVQRLSATPELLGENVETLMPYGENIVGTFLDDLELKQLVEYETWRLTMQVHYNGLKERLLDALVDRSMGTERAIDYGLQMVRLVPQSEKAWFLLIKAFIKMEYLYQAQKTMDMAQAALKCESVPHMGLLAVANQELLTAGKTMASEKNQPPAIPSQAPPTLAINDCTSAGKLASDFLQQVSEAIFSSTHCNKVFIILAKQLTGNERSSDSFQIGNQGAAVADFCLASSITRLDPHYVLDIQLVHNISGACLRSWQVHLDGVTQQIVVEQIRAELSSRFEFDFPLAMANQAREKSSGERTALDCFYLALPYIFSLNGYSPDNALAMLEQALAKDPNLAYALCVMAWVKSTHPQYNGSQFERGKLAAMARRAVELAIDNPAVLALAAINIANLEKDLDTALHLARRGARLNPHSTFCLLALAILEHYAGNDDDSLRHLDAIDLIGDVEPFSYFSPCFRARCYYSLGRIEEAIAVARTSLGRNFNIITLRVLTASLSRSGQLEEARKCAQKMLQADASEYLQFYRDFFPYRSSATIECLCEDLARVGIPEGPPARG